MTASRVTPWLHDLRVDAYGVTDVGLVRRTNEDAFVMAELRTGRRWSGGVAHWSTSPGGLLLAVSDGMGGAKAGEVASALTVEGVVRGMVDASRDQRPNGESLRRVIEQASWAVYQAGKRPDRRGMGATLTALVMAGTSAWVAQIGDSRAYLLRDGTIGRLTHDQSYVQLLVDAGLMTEEEAEKSAAKNVILQVMGQEEIRVALGQVELHRGDRLLVCSDGLTNVLDDETLNLVASPPVDLVLAGDELVAKTRRGGAPDNVTVVLADVT